MASSRQGSFVSDDGGESFHEVEGLRRHPSRPQWQPGGIGLVLHSIVSDPADARRLWVGISSVGVFYTEDGGETWSPRNSGTRCDYLPEGERYPEFGQCVHNLTLAPGQSNRLYQQNHCGMYRSDDGGASWRSIEDGLPSSFGFPVATHPRDADTLFFLPLNGDTKGRYPPDARTAVWRSRDGGAHWRDGRAGLPQAGAYFGVMRQAMATDAPQPRRRLFRHEQWLSLCEPRRGRDMGLHRTRPAGDFLGRDDDGDLMRTPSLCACRRC